MVNVLDPLSVSSSECPSVCGTAMTTATPPPEDQTKSVTLFSDDHDHMCSESFLRETLSWSLFFCSWGVFQARISVFKVFQDTWHSNQEILVHTGILPCLVKWPHWYLVPISFTSHSRCWPFLGLLKVKGIWGNAGSSGLVTGVHLVF